MMPLAQLSAPQGGSKTSSARIAIRQTERAQCVVETPRKRSRGTLHMKAEARIAD
jgi:hypothetical protein